MKKNLNYKSEESRAREQEHWFGQPNGNKAMPSAEARSMRDFYRWVESVATQEELEQYVANKKNPYARRKFIQAITGTVTMHDFFELTDQTHGKPKEQVEVSTDKETAAAIRAEWETRYGNKG